MTVRAELAPFDALLLIRLAAAKATLGMVTLRAALMLTEHVPVPVQSPLQPPNSEPDPALAVSVTTTFCANDALQVLPHEMPAGAELTEPLPAPARVTPSDRVTTEKLAVTATVADIGTVQVGAVPEQPPPLQPVKLAPDCGVAVSVIGVFCATLAVQSVAGQSMPPMFERTDPEPDTITVRPRLPAGSAA